MSRYSRATGFREPLPSLHHEGSDWLERAPYWRRLTVRSAYRSSRRRSSALETTVTLEADMARAPNSGRSITPKAG